ncbi:hypothetical protein NUW58_g2661 [Xylaria curta]|uniref:Uncharacterized protein n=1 Tax=Xylaria curta TaxID=42375 RepID=A0ACC1PH74_9PEZI|nr:hypothetical protein NUW58_g2661 [Xylaria curta]
MTAPRGAVGADSSTTPSSSPTRSPPMAPTIGHSSASSPPAVPLTVAPFAAGSLNPAMDAILCALLLVHSHAGMQSVIIDYVPNRKYPGAYKASLWLLNIATVLAGIGLYEFETNDVGVTEAVKRTVRRREAEFDDRWVSSYLLSATRAAAARQRQPAIARSTGAAARRCFADEKKPSIGDSRPPKLPVTETHTGAASKPAVPKVDADIVSSAIDAKDAPKTPPTPESVAPVTTGTTKPPPRTPSAPIKKKGFFRRLRNYLLTLTLLGAITFGGGVWYSRISDNFHDFFTEYVPFGEQAVLYFEEAEFRKRYPGTLGSGTKAKDTGAQVKIAPQSGASAIALRLSTATLKTARLLPTVSRSAQGSQAFSKGSGRRGCAWRSHYRVGSMCGCTYIVR